MNFSRRWAAVLVALGAMVCGSAWALSSPIGSSPDDQYHLTSIWCAGAIGSDDCKLVPGEEFAVQVPALVANGPGCYAGHNDVSAACQEPLAGQAVNTTTINRGSYPGGFYRVMHLFVTDHIGESVVAMRVTNVLIAVLLFTALALSGTWATTRLQVYALSVALVPLGWFIVASTNPSSWAITGVTAYGFALHSLLIVRRRWKLVANGAVALLGAGIGVAARGDAGVYVVIVTAAVGILHWRTLRARPRLLVVPAVACLLAVLVALSAQQLSGVAEAAPETDRTRAEVIVTFLLEFPSLISGSYGYAFGLGWLDTPVHSITAFTMSMILGFMVLSGASRGSRSKTLAVLLLGGAMLAFPAWTFYRARLIPGESVQPRYLLPVIPVLLLLMLTARKPWRSLQSQQAAGVDRLGAAHRRPRSGPLHQHPPLRHRLRRPDHHGPRRVVVAGRPVAVRHLYLGRRRVRGLRSDDHPPVCPTTGALRPSRRSRATEVADRPDHHGEVVVMSYRLAPSAQVADSAAIGDGSAIWHLAQVREDAVLGRAASSAAAPTSAPACGWATTARSRTTRWSTSPPCSGTASSSARPSCSPTTPTRAR